MFELDDGCRRLSGHIMDSILVAEPVGALDSIVHVPSPIVLVHVTERSVDAALGSDSVASGREELRDTGCVEAGLGKTEGCPQAGTASSDNNRIVLVVLHIRRSATDGSRPLLFAEWDFSEKLSRTYNDGILVANKRRCLLGPQRPICNYPGYTTSCLAS